MAWEKADPVKLLGYAKRCCEEGFALLEGGDPFTASEKVWEGVWLATLALAIVREEAFNPHLPLSWRERVERALSSAGLGEEEAREWAGVFIEARQRLHGEVYLARWYEEKEHLPVFERGRAYVELISKLLNAAEEKTGANTP